jgi:hypothetical protein
MFGRRSDGIKLKTIDPFFKTIPYLMPDRIKSQQLIETYVDCEILDNFIKKMLEQGCELSYMHIAIASIVRLLAKRPRMNRFIKDSRLYKHKNISVSITVKKELKEDCPESTAKMEFNGTEDIFEIKQIIDAAINEAVNTDNSADQTTRMLMRFPHFIRKFVFRTIHRLDNKGRLPKSFIKTSPFHASAFLSNVKSIKLPHFFHHLYDLGTISLFVTMGKEALVPAVDGGEVVVKKQMGLGISVDERVCDGLYYSASLRYLYILLKNPEQLCRKLDNIEPDID